MPLVDPTIEPDDIVLTPQGEATVVEVLDDTFVTKFASGLLATWRLRDVEVFEHPGDTVSREEVEQWLRCKVRVIPGVTIVDDTKRCTESCGCTFCYVVVKHITRGADVHNPEIQVRHFIDAEACRCTAKSCPCDMDI